MQKRFRITWDGKQSTVSTLPKIAARRFSWTELSKIRKGADDTGRNSSYGRWEMYFAATRCASLLSDKYDITKHPNYKYLSDFDKRNAFDVERICLPVRQS